MTKQKRNRMIIAILCAVLILTYAVLIYLPHSHNDHDFNCSVCSLIQFSRKGLFIFALCAALSQLLNGEIVRTSVCSHALSLRDTTLVGLKVKLSD